MVGPSHENSKRTFAEFAFGSGIESNGLISGGRSVSLHFWPFGDHAPGPREPVRLIVPVESASAEVACYPDDEPEQITHRVYEGTCDCMTVALIPQAKSERQNNSMRHDHASNAMAVVQRSSAPTATSPRTPRG